ncbi:proline--tRNA ligase 1 [Lysinibacillus alkalisoli]|uniref:Proline--tRNA ligase n=1 Tax=Lysinibacillus alkalisoli TaxID=1911548 RepID=A0A917LGX1_9BACI|nr:proline--tRNA ligase [Lysinibacillus alkalisoli]GGG22064.1 proline--tRNA ligase 1 [Lysinibacillus alkalisoli]
MKQSQIFIPTLREIPADAELRSHQHLLRAGFIRQMASGIYSYLPLATRVIRKIEKIIREELEKLNAVETILPIMQPVELWQTSGRQHTNNKEVFTLQDQHERKYMLAAAQEECITSLVRDEINTYKRLPLMMYQIQTKFRDENRPRHGLLRAREFIMKDAYSFHDTKASLDDMYNEMFNAYASIFTRLGLQYHAVIAESDLIGGKDTHEFIVVSPNGENVFAYTPHGTYAATLSLAEVNTVYETSEEPMRELTLVATPQQRTIEAISEWFDMPKKLCIKTLVLLVDGDIVVTLVRGDHDVSLAKVKVLLQAHTVALADEQVVAEVLGCEVGYVGPIKLPLDIRVVADHAVLAMRNAVAGANESGYHYQFVNPERDFAINISGDIRYIQEGEVSPDGATTVKFGRGIEVGHIFKLGTVYSEQLAAIITNEEGQQTALQMGCYGMGISRLVAALAEQYHDDGGFTWPKHLAPFHVHLIPVNIQDEVQLGLAEDMYGLLKSYHFEVLIDDRDERAGVKFTDADLIGLPVRVTIGKKAAEGIVEVKVRTTGETYDWQKEELIDKLTEMFRN